MFAKSNKLGFVSLFAFAVLASALGGCAESVGQPASAEGVRPMIAMSRFQAPNPELESTQAFMKTEVQQPRSEKRMAKSAVADTR
jgi:hypothetical protein